MNIKQLLVNVAVCAATVAATNESMAGGTYNFTVSCRSGQHIEVWETGAIDPGKEYLRVSTGTNNPMCAVGDYNPQRDDHLRVIRHAGAGAVLPGATPLILLLGAIFGI